VVLAGISTRWERMWFSTNIDMPKYKIDILIGPFTIEAKDEDEMLDRVEQACADIVMDSKFARDYIDWEEIGEDDEMEESCSQLQK